MRCADSVPTIIGNIIRTNSIRPRFLSDVTKENNEPDIFINNFIYLV